MIIEDFCLKAITTYDYDTLIKAVQMLDCKYNVNWDATELRLAIIYQLGNLIDFMPMSRLSNVYTEGTFLYLIGSSGSFKFDFEVPVVGLFYRYECERYWVQDIAIHLSKETMDTFIKSNKRYTLFDVEKGVMLNTRSATTIRGIECSKEEVAKIKRLMLLS